MTGPIPELTECEQGRVRNCNRTEPEAMGPRDSVPITLRDGPLGGLDLCAVAWTEPLYPRSVVNRAGRTYVDPAASAEEREVALAIINNWRSAHAFPLNTLQMSLRGIANQIDRDPTIAQRIKRLPSIRHKLER